MSKIFNLKKHHYYLVGYYDSKSDDFKFPLKHCESPEEVLSTIRHIKMMGINIRDEDIAIFEKVNTRVSTECVERVEYDFKVKLS